METLQEIQQESRRMILEAVHGVSYGEALEKELGLGCILISKNRDKQEMIERISPHGTLAISDGGFGLDIEDINHYYKIIGKPITFARVLLALEKQFKNEYHKMIFQDGQIFFICAETPVCQFYWSLEKEIIEEQNEETQRRINQLLKGQ